MFAFAKIPFSLGFGVLFEGVGVLTGCDPPWAWGQNAHCILIKDYWGKSMSEQTH